MAKIKKMENWKKMNDDFFSLFVLALICMANIASAVIHGMNNDWASVTFNILIAAFTAAVIIHLIRNN